MKRFLEYIAVSVFILLVVGYEYYAYQAFKEVTGKDVNYLQYKLFTQSFGK